MAGDLSVLHTIAGLHPNAGGPSRTVVQLVDALSREDGLSISLLTQTITGETLIQPTATSVGCNINQTSSRAVLALGMPLRRGLQHFAGPRQPRLVHSHGLWLPANLWTARYARRDNIPLLIHPHGMLEAWALQHRAWKKRLAMQLYQRRDLERAALFFATAPQEVESIRRLGLKQPVAVIPNGVELSTFTSNVTEDNNRPSQGAVRNAVFMGRIHPIKGLLNLVEAWARSHSGNWRLIIAGPDEGGHQAEVVRRVQELGLEESVEFAGEVEGAAKRALFDSAELFILPSFSENFGVVVAEALAHGVPVITTHGTPWEGLISHGCGWWIESTADALAETLQEAMNMNAAELHAMGEKGREYAREFDWSHIAHQTADVYRWVLGEGAMPMCVELD